jgi:hypothetical protein
MVVTFESAAFNMAEPKEYFINPCCFGDDVAKRLISELRKQGVETDEKPGQEDFGWYLNFRMNTGHTFVIGHRPNGESEAGTWIGWLERRRSLIGSVVGGCKRGNPVVGSRGYSRNLIDFSANSSRALALPT